VRVEKGLGSEPMILGTLTQGDIVGEMALITHEPRSATVTAVEPTEVLVLTQEFFNRNLKQLPPWMSKTIVALAQRLNKANTIRYDTTTTENDGDDGES
jgi:CRP-like cAMP-binding protein